MCDTVLAECHAQLLLPEMATWPGRSMLDELAVHWEMHRHGKARVVKDVAEGILQIESLPFVDTRQMRVLLACALLDPFRLG